MFKWLGKVLGSDTGAAAETPGTVEAPLSPAEKSARRERECERPLAAPPVSLDDPSEDVGNDFVARQAIMNREHRLIGYEFMMRDRARSRTSLDVQTQKINDQLLLRAINSIGIERLAKFRQVWISVVDAFLASPMIDSLPAAATVLVIRIPGHGGTLDQSLLERARQLKQAGYRLALSNWSETPAHHAWLGLLDYLVIDTTAYNPAEVGEMARTIGQRAAGIEILARQIESFEEYEFCQRARYHLYQGNFLTKRENWPPQPKMSADRIRLCDLLNRLRAGDEIADIAAQLRQSPELSYRLLRYINSAAMGLQTRVASIERGLVYLGREKLYRWLTLLLFNADDAKTTDGALLEQGLVRGRMMENLAAGTLSRLECDELFIVGIFSLLDVLMKLPMSVALNPLQLPPAVAGALVDDSGGYAPYLRLAVACENHDSERLAAAAGELGFSVAVVNSAHFDALAWVQDTLAPPDGKSGPAA